MAGNALSQSVLLGDFRSKLADYVSSLDAHPRKVLALKRRSDVVAYLVSHVGFSAFLNALNEPDDARRTNQLIAWLIVDHWLRDAPAHIRDPQLLEIEPLRPPVKYGLLQINPERATMKDLEEIGLVRPLAERLLKRHKVAKAIHIAEKEELYEALDHKTSLAE